MIDWLIEYAAIIDSCVFRPETGPGLKVVERYEIRFIDASRLLTYESRKGPKFKYSYQWMTPDNQTIYRWDNTPHFPEFSTFPHHRHVGPDELAEPFPAMTLAGVLGFIAVGITQPD